MLFVTSHGGKDGINNAYAFETPGGRLLSKAVFDEPAAVELSELRCMLLFNRYLTLLRRQVQ